MDVKPMCEAVARASVRRECGSAGYLREWGAPMTARKETGVSERARCLDAQSARSAAARTGPTRKATTGCAAQRASRHRGGLPRQSGARADPAIRSRRGAAHSRPVIQALTETQG